MLWKVVFSSWLQRAKHLTAFLSRLPGTQPPLMSIDVFICNCDPMQRENGLEPWQGGGEVLNSKERHACPSVLRTGAAW